jgi:hypothetical protein
LWHPNPKNVNFHIASDAIHINISFISADVHTPQQNAIHQGETERQANGAMKREHLAEAKI